jgi:transposase
MIKLNLSIIEIIKKVILSNVNLTKFYFKKSPSSKYNLELILSEIIYVLKTGLSWNNLRSTINPKSLYWHFNRFVKNNIFHDTFIYLRNKYSESNKTNIQIIDSTFVMNKFGKNSISRSKFFKNKNCNKISLVTDINGIPISILFDAGNVHDITFVKTHLNDLVVIPKKNNFNSTILLADKGYISKDLREDIKNKFNYSLMYPIRKNMKQKLSNYDSELYKKRIRIEHTNRRLKLFRRIDARYDSYLDTFSSFVFLAASIMITKHNF